LEVTYPQSPNSDHLSKTAEETSPRQASSVEAKSWSFQVIRRLPLQNADYPALLLTIVYANRFFAIGAVAILNRGSAHVPAANHPARLTHQLLLSRF